MHMTSHKTLHWKSYWAVMPLDAETPFQRPRHLLWKGHGSEISQSSQSNPMLVKPASPDFRMPMDQQWHQLSRLCNTIRSD